jgi:YVTN family beta-propeller protein
LLALAAVFGCVAAASASAAPLAYTSNYEAGTVSVIDTGTNQVVGKPIEVGTKPSSPAITPNGGKVFVDNSNPGGAGSVSVIATATRTVAAPIPVGLLPEGIAITPDGTTAYVTSRESDQISVINTASDQVVKTITTANDPVAVAVAPNGKFAYVVGGDEFVEVIDTQTNQVVGTPFVVGADPINLTFTPDGKTAYVVDNLAGEVSVVNTALGQTVGTIAVGGSPNGIAVTPNGQKLFVGDEANGTVTVVNTQTNQIVGSPITVGESGGGETYEIAITPNGATAYVANLTSEDVVRINTATDQVVGSPIEIPGAGPWQIAITPDQSPTASFAAPSVPATYPAAFSGASSTDPDGTVASWAWAFGDGGTASGVTATHTYVTAGTYDAELSVVDNEGCGEEEVFTGRTAYCSGNPLAKAMHPVEVKTAPIVCSGKFRLGRLIHKRKNGTVRLQVKLPAAGSIFLFGRKVHAVTRKAKKAGSMWLTIHARVELNKRLKKIHRAPVRIRVTFTPSTSCGRVKTLHRSLSLLHAPRKKHHHR